MSKIYYIEDPYGTIMSENGLRRFKMLEGTMAFDFLNTPEGKACRFMKVCDYGETDDEVFVEVSSENMKDFRKYERREQYVADTIRDNEYMILSLSYEETEDSEETLESVIADEDVDIQEDVLHQCDLETLRKALKTLSEEELALITALYLSDEPMTLREYAKVIGVHFTTVDYRVKCIFEKIKKYF